MHKLYPTKAGASSSHSRHSAQRELASEVPHDIQPVYQRHSTSGIEQSGRSGADTERLSDDWRGRQHHCKHHILPRRERGVGARRLNEHYI